VTAYIKNLKPGGEMITTNQSADCLTLSDGTRLGAFGEHAVPTYTCRHCCHVIPLKSVRDIVEHCRHCRSAICNDCATKLWSGEDTCRPFKEEGGDLDLYERGKILVLR